MTLNFGWVYLHANVTGEGIHSSNVLYWKSRQQKSCQANTLVLMFLFCIHIKKQDMWLFFHKDATSLKHCRREEVVYSSLLSLVVHPQQRRLLCLYMQKTLWLAMNINTSGFVQRGKHSCVIARSGTERLLPCHNLNTRFQKRQEYYTLQKADLQSICDTKASFFPGSFSKTMPSREMI